MRLKAAVSDISADLREEYNGTVRGIACFVEGEYHIDFLRDDVRENLGEAKVYEILDDAQLASLGHPGYEDLYESELEGVVRVFNRSVVITVPVSDEAGILLSLDPTGEFHGRSVIRTVKEYLPDTERINA